MKKAKKKAPKKQAKKQAKPEAEETISDCTGQPGSEEPPQDEREEVPAPEPEPEDSGFVKAEVEMIHIVGEFPNKMWKKGITDAGRGEGCKVWVPKRFSHKLNRKVIECQRVDENGETYYKYMP